MPALWKRIYEIERRDLLDGRHPAGEVFATTETLAGKHGISHVTAHRILRALEQDSLVRNVNRVGSVVLERRPPVAIRFLLPTRFLSEDLSINVSLGMQGVFEEAVRRGLEIRQVTMEGVFRGPSEGPSALIYCYDTTQPGTDVMLQLLPDDVFPIALDAPCVLERGAAIGGDHTRMMHDLTRCFIDRGCRRIGYLGSAAKVWGFPRFQGYLAAMQEAGLFVSYDLAYTCLIGEESEQMHRSIARWAERKQLDAICAYGHGYAELLHRALPEGMLKTVPIGYIGWTSEACGSSIRAQPDYLKQGNESVRLAQELDRRNFPSPFFLEVPGHLFTDGPGPAGRDPDSRG